MSNKYARTRTPPMQTFHKSSVAKAISAAIITSMISLPVLATEQEEEEMEVIMVTATKKNETIQEVPLAVTAFTGDFIEKVRLSDVKDLVAYSPGVNGNSSNSFLDSVSVRGVRTEDYGSGGDPSLGFFKNDLYEGRTGSAVSSLYDMDRAEIVNGPQGFLFGRNAIGGAISVHTKRAELVDFGANLDLDVGEYDLVKINGAVNIPINDNFAMRFAALYHNEESYIENVNPDDKLQDIDVSAIRWSTTFEKDDLTIYTTVEFEDREYPAGQYRFVEEGELWEKWDSTWGVGNRGSERDIDTNSHWGLRDESEVLNLQLRIEQKFDFADLTFNAGYKDHDYWYSEQWLPSPIANGSWAVDQEGDYSQAELRLSSNGKGPLSWYVGASVYEEDLEVDTLNQMSDEFMCDYYNSYYNTYTEENYFPSLSNSTTGHCENLYNNSLAYHGPGYYGHYADDGYYGVNYYFPNLSSPYDRADDKVFENSYADAKNNGWAVYASIGYQINETVDIEVGVRHTDDTKEFANALETTGYSGTPGYNPASNWNVGGTTELDANGNPIAVKSKDSWDDTSFKYLIRWKPTDDMMLYASYTEGFKSGGFDSYSLERTDGGINVGMNNDNSKVVQFKPEFVESYELGYKDTWFEYTDVRLTAYMYEYSNLQVRTREEGVTVVTNLGYVDAIGLEGATITNLGDNWTFMMNFHAIDSESHGVQDKCDDTDECEGDRMPWVPEFSGAMVLNGHFPLDSGAAITTSIESYWEGEHGGGFRYNEEWMIDSSQTWNARLGYDSGTDWYVEAYVDNLTDETNFDSAYEGSVSYPHQRWASWKPRSYGLRFGMSWN